MIDLQDFISSVLTLFLIFYLYSSTLVSFFIPITVFYGYDWLFIVYLSYLSLVYVLIIILYAFVSLSDPGTVPDWYCELYPSKESVDVIPLDSNRPRWCEICSSPKPPRSHHCSICNRCILKMDHHCKIFLILGPWISNCIGFYNQGNFLKFLFYSVLALLMLVFGIAYFPFHLKVNLSLFLEISSGFQIAIWILNVSILIILFPSLILLFVQNFRMACNNITYIEQLQLEFAKKKHLT